MSAIEQATVVWEPGTYVLWGDPDDANYAEQRGTVVEHKVAAGRGDHGEDLSHYEVKREHDGVIVHLDGSEIAPAYKRGLDAIPDINGKLVRVGDWVAYPRRDEYGGDTDPVMVKVVKVKPQAPGGEMYVGRLGGKKTDRLDLEFSSVSVHGYGSGEATFTLDMMRTLNVRGDWQGGMSRDPHGEPARALRKIEVSEEQELRLEIHATRNEIQALGQAAVIVDRRLSEAQDKLGEQNAKLAQILGLGHVE